MAGLFRLVPIGDASYFERARPWSAVGAWGYRTAHSVTTKSSSLVPVRWSSSYERAPSWLNPRVDDPDIELIVQVETDVRQRDDPGADRSLRQPDSCFRRDHVDPARIAGCYLFRAAS